MDNIYSQCTDYVIFTQLHKVGKNMPNPIFRMTLIAKKELSNIVTIIQSWLKSCFFSTESESEYFYSKRYFHQWINQISQIIGDNLHSSINHWIKTSLDPYDTMWLNYLKKYMTGNAHFALWKNYLLKPLQKTGECQSEKKNECE